MGTGGAQEVRPGHPDVQGRDKTAEYLPTRPRRYPGRGVGQVLRRRERPGEFRVAMLLLAAAAGYPALTRDWFEQLRSADQIDGLTAPGRDSAAWLQFKKVYGATFSRDVP